MRLIAIAGLAVALCLTPAASGIDKPAGKPGKLCTPAIAITSDPLSPTAGQADLSGTWSGVTGDPVGIQVRYKFWNATKWNTYVFEANANGTWSSTLVCGAGTWDIEVSIIGTAAFDSGYVIVQ